MEYGCIGEHLPHSFSKIIHDKIGRYPYVLHEVAKDELDLFMKEHDFKGINVTIPYKQDVIPYLDEIDEKAKAIGAVNTILNKDGKLYGYNTDFSGMEALIGKMGADLKNKKVLILGTGGTSKTAYAVAKHLGAGSIYKCSRHESPDTITYKEAETIHKDAEIVINTTPCGMYPNIIGQAMDLTPFTGLEAVIDAVYNPLSPQLVRQAKSMGVKAEGGLYMLVAQAVFAAEYFSGEPFEEGRIDRIYKEVLDTKRNIVFIGMPSSGKSTIGRLIGKKYGMPMVDTDARIVEKAGMPITEIFSKYGETYFRDLETEVIRELSVENGKILSTGGGAVLRPENVDALKMNGIVVYLDRSLDFLQPTGDRPLSNDENKLKKMYEFRLPIYRKAADITITTDGTKEETVEAVLNALETK